MKKVYKNPEVNVKFMAITETIMAASAPGEGDLGYGGNATGNDNQAEGRQTVSENLFI